MKKVICIIVVATALSLSSLVFAGGSCPPNTACSEHYQMPIAQGAPANPVSEKTSSAAKSTKMVKLRTFSEILNTTANGALYDAQRKASAWLEKRDPDSIISYSETATCNKYGRCSAFVTIAYRAMVTPAEIKEEELKQLPPTTPTEKK